MTWEWEPRQWQCFEMNDLAQEIRGILEPAQAPGLLCSWGKDSSLLLHYALQARPDIAIYYFGDDLPEVAARQMKDDGFPVYSFAPARHYGTPETLIDEYSFNGTRVPMLSAMVASDDCTHEHLRQKPVDFYFPNDVVLWGYRYPDSHPLLPDVKFEREIQLGHTKFIAPLYDLTTDQVLNALDALNLEYAVDEPVLVCEDCMNALISNATTLAGFQERPLNH